MKLPDNILNLAITQSKKSPMNQKHGAVIFKGKDILGTGFNFNVNNLYDASSRAFSIHAEKDCLKGLRFDQIINSDILVVRVTKSNKLAYSAPCKGCRKLLRRKGIRKVYWFDYEETLTYTRLN